ncbi:MAG: sulfatase [Cytophagales bacterium]|nr:sulfatase [Cytophagales bacterium]
MRPKTSMLICGFLLIALVSACSKRDGGNDQQTNVLFIAVDDLRPELGCYGKEYMHAPNMDKLASEGIVFRNHFVHCAACGPSRSTLLSGKRTLSWDVFRDIREAGSKPDRIFSLPQLFKEHGYKTVCIGKISHLPGGVTDALQQIHEVPYSWDTAYAPAGEWKDPWGAFFSYTGGKTRLYGYDRGNDTDLPPFEAAEVTDTGYADGLNAEEAVKQLRELKDVPFFLAVGFYKPHLPFNAPKKYWDLYDPDKIPEADHRMMPEKVRSNILLHGNHTSYEPRTHYRWAGDSSNYIITPEKERILKHGYCAAVSYVDGQIGKVLDELKRLELDKKTIVMLWGDHGWHLGDYGIWGKYTNFDVALRSPLIIKTPHMSKPGVSANGIVETVDIFPTLADLCKLPVPDNLDGISMKPIINDPNSSIKAYSVGERNAWDVHGTTIRTERYRLMVWKANNGDTLDVHLFDNTEEPLPYRNVVESRPETVKRLLDMLRSENLKGI